ncbi:MAG: TolB family protein [Terracidiphilus sp.]
MRIRYFVAFLLTTGIGFSQVSSKQTGGCVGCFSEPQSTLLFSPVGGDTNYGNYTLVTPRGSFTVPQLSGPMERASPNWAISPSGDRVAGGISFMLNADVVKCDPKIKGWCDPHPRPIFKSVMGVYSVRDKMWKQYGDFETVGSAAFSPDGKRIAFDGEKECTGVNCDAGLTILDLETGHMGTIPESIQVDWRNQISWSPDGKFLAVSAVSPGNGRIVVFDVATGKMMTIAQGTNPSWSPKGDWIAYAFIVQCMIIHPDGTGARSVLDKERKWMKYTLDGPILWSPAGDRLLLNQRKIFGGHPRVIMVDLATGHAVLKSKNGEMVSGWVPYTGK